MKMDTSKIADFAAPRLLKALRAMPHRTAGLLAGEGSESMCEVAISVMLDGILMDYEYKHGDDAANRAFLAKHAAVAAK